MKFSRMCAVAALACAGTAMTVSASTVTVNGGVRQAATGGGEFRLDFGNGRVFKSFCLERGETLALGGTYNYTMSTQGAFGGGGPSPLNNPDAVSSATAWLFTSWLRGSTGAANIALNNTDPAHATAIQFAIWTIEGEGLPSGFSLSQLAQDLLDYIDDNNISKTNNAITDDPLYSNIRVVNPTDMTSGANRQSQIILIPLPAASGMALAGLALVGGVRRRK